VVAGVHRTRLALLGRGPQDAAAWRRLTVTERIRTDVARLTGAASESVRLAIALLADRRARLGDPAHADTAEAQIILGQTLLAAGHPAAARRHLEEAADTRRSRFLLTSYRVQEDLIWLAKTALVLGHPRTVLDLLAGQAAQTDWFRDQVSFRLGYTARRLAAMARGELGQAGEAAGDLLAARAELADWPLDAGLDSLAADFDRSLAELALMSGEAADAADALVRLAEAETKSGAGGASRSGAGSGAGDPHRPLRRGRAPHAAGDTRQAAKLLAPVLDRTLLAHGRPAIGEAHPLLTRARTLAERLGITVPYTLPGLDEAPLDLDV
jgi:hypothetical protein